MKRSVILSKVTGQTRSTVGRVIMNTVIQAVGSKGDGVVEVARMVLVMKTVVLGQTISKTVDILA